MKAIERGEREKERERERERKHSIVLLTLELRSYLAKTYFIFLLFPFLGSEL